jgi:hypothetical protein
VVTPLASVWAFPFLCSDSLKFLIMILISDYQFQLVKKSSYLDWVKQKRLIPLRNQPFVPEAGPARGG